MGALQRFLFCNTAQLPFFCRNGSALFAPAPVRPWLQQRQGNPLTALQLSQSQACSAPTAALQLPIAPALYFPSSQQQTSQIPARPMQPPMPRFAFSQPSCPPRLSSQHAPQGMGSGPPTHGQHPPAAAHAARFTATLQPQQCALLPWSQPSQAGLAGDDDEWEEAGGSAPLPKQEPSGNLRQLGSSQEPRPSHTAARLLGEINRRTLGGVSGGDNSIQALVDFK